MQLWAPPLLGLASGNSKYSLVPELAQEVHRETGRLCERTRLIEPVGTNLSRTSAACQRQTCMTVGVLRAIIGVKAADWHNFAQHMCSPVVRQSLATLLRHSFGEERIVEQYPADRRNRKWHQIVLSVGSREPLVPECGVAVDKKAHANK